MSYIICFIIIVSIASMLAEILKNKIDITIPISVIAIVLIIYPFGFIQKLNIGVYAVCIISLISILFTIYKIIKKLKNGTIKELTARIITPGLFTYVFFWGLFIYINRGRMFRSWDEFSHWGLIVKNMFNFDSYGTNPETIVLFRGYPPFTAIFQYFFIKVKNTYVEGSIIIAMNVLYISIMLPVLRNINWKRGLEKLIIYIPLLFVLPLCLYEYFYTTIYVDAILGVFFAYILYIYYSIKEEKVKYISIGLGLIALSLIKSAGTGLAIFVLLIILVDNLYKRKTSNINIKKFLIVFTILILCIIIGKYSWSIHLKVTNTETAWNTSNVNFSNIINLVKGQGKEYQYTVIKNFFENFLYVPLEMGLGSLTNLHMLLIYVLYSVYTIQIVKNNDTEKTKYKNCTLTCFMLVICYIIYLLSLLILYLFTYSEYEALNLASYGRYSFIFLIGIFIFNTLIIVDSIKEIKTDKINVLVLIMILCIIIPYGGVRSLIIKKNETIQESIVFRNNYIGIKKYKEKINKKDKIYYISCGSNGIDSHVSRYEMIPLNIQNFGLWSLGKPRYTGDIWSFDITVEEWKYNLIDNEYSYVYIFKKDDIFVEKYGVLFENKDSINDKSLYRVNIDDNNVVLSKI